MNRGRETSVPAAGGNDTRRLDRGEYPQQGLGVPNSRYRRRRPPSCGDQGDFRQAVRHPLSVNMSKGSSDGRVTNPVFSAEAFNLVYFYTIIYCLLLLEPKMRIFLLVAFVLFRPTKTPCLPGVRLPCGITRLSSRDTTPTWCAIWTTVSPLLSPQQWLGSQDLVILDATNI